MVSESSGGERQQMMAGKPERFGGKPSPIFFPAISFRPSRIFFPAISFRAFGGKGESFCFGGKGITLFAAGTTICFVCFVPRDVLLSPSLHSLAASTSIHAIHPSPTHQNADCRHDDSRLLKAYTYTIVKDTDQLDLSALLGISSWILRHY